MCGTPYIHPDESILLKLVLLMLPPAKKHDRDSYVPHTRRGAEGVGDGDEYF